MDNLSLAKDVVAHSLQGNQADPGFWCYVDQHIDVTVRPEIAAHGGTEDRQFAHGMGATECLKVSLRNVKLWIHGDADANQQVANLPLKRRTPKNNGTAA